MTWTRPRERVRMARPRLNGEPDRRRVSPSIRPGRKEEGRETRATCEEVRAPAPKHLACSETTSGESGPRRQTPLEPSTECSADRSSDEASRHPATRHRHRHRLRRRSTSSRPCGRTARAVRSGCARHQARGDRARDARAQEQGPRAAPPRARAAAGLSDAGRRARGDYCRRRYRGSNRRRRDGRRVLSSEVHEPERRTIDSAAPA
jgi:hypothetical protein